MNTILIKILATALAFSQVTTRPDAIKSEFDPQKDQAEVAQLLSAGCLHMRKSFDIEQINLDDLITTAMDDKGALGGEIKALKGLSIEDLHATYRQFCKNETVANSPVDLTDVISFYNNALKDLPDAAKLKGNKLPGMSVLLDSKGERFAEVFTPENRRVFVPISDIPDGVRNAFIAAEDKRFLQHRGVDERGLVRAFIGNLAQPGRPQGGSTITQQLVKTLLVGNDVTYERKLREIILASNIERTLSKTEILELYLNSIYLGRGAWGVELAARAYFGKSVSALTPAEGAFLAGLAKGPNYFNPDRNLERARERFKYVLGRMAEDKFIAAEEAKAPLPTIVAYERLRQDIGFHFVDQVQREAKAIPNVGALNASSYQVHTTIHPQLQRATESILQEGLARYELNTGRAKFTGAEANLTEAIQTLSKDGKLTGPAWLAAMKNLRLPLYDVHWEPAVIVENGRSKKGDVITAGLADGRLLPLNTWNANIRRQLKVNDVVYVRVREAAQKQAARAELRIRPSVQGSILVLENKTGRLLAMAGAFSYPDSQLNRAVQSVRQPGSTFKPLTYLTALQKGLQPNTLVADEPLTLPPIGNSAYARWKDYWSPKNADGGGSGIITMRRALEGSRNLATAQLMAYGLESTSEAGLDRICETAVEAQLYKQCSRYYPFILGAQPLRMIDLAAFYAAIANEGARPVPHAIDSIEQQGREIYKADPNAAVWIGANDRASFFQLKSMLQGVLLRGTARAAGHLAPYAAGKTGTTDNELDAWFVGFTNDVTVAIWVGYDNADGNRKTLGRGQTGGRVALPMFEPILQSVWALYAPKTALAGPSKEAMRDLVAVRVDAYSGATDEYGEPRYDAYGRPFQQQSAQGGTVEYLKKSAAGGVADTRYRIVSGGQNYGYGRGGDFDEDGTPMVQQQQRSPFDFFGSLFGGQPQPSPYYSRRAQPGMTYPDEENTIRAPRRVDPDYFFGRRQY
jgi:membrane carboxypeptidase/penicillin-binding protein